MIDTRFFIIQDLDCVRMPPLSEMESILYRILTKERPYTSKQRAWFDNQVGVHIIRVWEHLYTNHSLYLIYIGKA